MGMDQDFVNIGQIGLTQYVSNKTVHSDHESEK